MLVVSAVLLSVTACGTAGSSRPTTASSTTWRFPVSLREPRTGTYDLLAQSSGDGSTSALVSIRRGAGAFTYATQTNQGISTLVYAVRDGRQFVAAQFIQYPNRQLGVCESWPAPAVGWPRRLYPGETWRRQLTCPGTGGATTVTVVTRVEGRYAVRVGTRLVPTVMTLSRQMTHTPGTSPRVSATVQYLDPLTGLILRERTWVRQAGRLYVFDYRLESLTPNRFARLRCLPFRGFLGSDGRGRVIETAGRTYPMAASGYAPNSRVLMRLTTTPPVTLSAIADRCGQLLGVISLPAKLRSRRGELILVGTGPTGRTARSATVVTVRPAPGH
jgi:hypothetical protein